MATIGIVVRPGVESASQMALQLCDWAAARGHSILVDEQSERAIRGASVACSVPCPTPPVQTHAEIVRLADPIVTLGGDGTLIGLARHVNGASPMILGVHFGNLGFLTETTPNELFNALERTLAGSAVVAERRMLRATVTRGGKEIFHCQALNDAVIIKEATARLLDIDIAVNGEDVMRLRGDGLILATPTGSTAYSLAAGGSIVHPSLNVMLVTPVCAHSLTARPLILSLSDTLIARIPDYDGSLVLSLDGQVSVPLLAGDAVAVQESPHRIKLVQSNSRSHFEILRTKLNWGIANKPD